MNSADRDVVQNWESMPWKQVRKGVEHKLLLMEETTLQLVRFQPAHDIRPHSHEFEQVACVLSGTLDYYVADEAGTMIPHRMGPGSTISIPRGRRHYGQNAGPEPVLNLDIFPLRREELLRRG